MAGMRHRWVCFPVAAPRRFGQKWRPDSSDEDEEVMPAARDLRLAKFVASREDESEDDEPGETSAIRRKWSTAALRNCDMKRDRRPLKSYEEESDDDITGRIQELREEIRNREVLGAERRRFDECGISPLTVKALTDAGYIQTTVVQEAALPVCLEGKDVLVKAKTGTGKSVAFLLPAIESVLNAMKSHTNHRVSPIFALVLCPTRELAVQVTAEANVLVKYHHGVGVQSLIGGTRFKLDQRRLESDPCQILVATPGRLLDHIENRSSFSVRLMGLKLLVLDEADHLLDLGFRKDIEKIADSLPRQRQTLLFSATVPKEVRRVSQMVLNKDHVFVDTVGLGAVETPTKVSISTPTQNIDPLMSSVLELRYNSNISWYHMNCTFIWFIAFFESILIRKWTIRSSLLCPHRLIKQYDLLVIVFCTTAMVTEFMYIMLRDLKLNVREIHSRKPQLYRTRISEEFRDSNRLILVTSDVSTRGVNYPDVTLVIQAGVPPGREHYIHRLGRTGREGKSGKGILLIAPWEEYFLKEIHDLPIQKAPVPQIDQEMKQKVDDSIKIVDMSIKEAAYHAWLGYYNSIADISRDKVMLADLASRFGVSIGMEKPPTLFRKTAFKMGCIYPWHYCLIVQPLTLWGVLACSQSASLRVHIGNIMLVSHTRGLGIVINGIDALSSSRMHVPKACRKLKRTPRGKSRKSFQGFLKMGILHWIEKKFSDGPSTFIRDHTYYTVGIFLWVLMAMENNSIW
uniref:ATP-dependent RNA helicase n=1 Tax=Aegilops tauschii TaxID=37682 RepID=M8B5F8_AEGTA